MRTIVNHYYVIIIELLLAIFSLGSDAILTKETTKRGESGKKCTLVVVVECSTI